MIAVGIIKKYSTKNHYFPTLAWAIKVQIGASSTLKHPLLLSYRALIFPPSNNTAIEWVYK